MIVAAVICAVDVVDIDVVDVDVVAVDGAAVDHADIVNVVAGIVVDNVVPAFLQIICEIFKFAQLMNS